jgi:hypothetical protein
MSVYSYFNKKYVCIHTHIQMTKKVHSESFPNTQYGQTQLTIKSSKLNLKVTWETAAIPETWLNVPPSWTLKTAPFPLQLDSIFYLSKCFPKKFIIKGNEEAMFFIQWVSGIFLKPCENVVRYKWTEKETWLT